MDASNERTLEQLERLLNRDIHEKGQGIIYKKYIYIVEEE